MVIQKLVRYFNATINSTFFSHCCLFDLLFLIYTQTIYYYLLIPVKSSKVLAAVKDVSSV